MSQVLVVCSANVCRSIYAEALLSSYLPAGIDVASAGIKAATGSEPCHLVRTRTHRLGIQLPSEGAKSCTSDGLAEAGLVLVMSRELQDAVARLDLSSRAKTFTIPAFSAALSVVAQQGLSVTTMSELTSLLNSRRGSIAQPPVQQRRGLLGRTISLDPHGIPDGHVISRRVHREALDMLEQHCERVAAAWATVWQPRELATS